MEYCIDCGHPEELCACHDYAEENSVAYRITEAGRAVLSLVSAVYEYNLTALDRSQLSIVCEFIKTHGHEYNEWMAGLSSEQRERFASLPDD